MNKRGFITLCLLALGALNVHSAIITGRILDESKLPLMGAFISIETNDFTISDNDGYFTLSGVPEGEHTLKVSFVSYEDYTKKIVLKSDETLVLEVQLTPGPDLNEVVVTGQLKGQARALNSQLSRDNITNIIAADQIGRFPDANIGDALKRVPGINVQYDQGEARFGNIRGTSPHLNSVTVNGERIPSAEAEQRSIQLDLVPSDMIQTIEVVKAVTPDMDADAIGGSVNLVTRAAPAAERFSATLGGGYNMLAGKPTWNGSLIYANRYMNKKLGMVLSVSYFNNNLGSDNIESEWTYDDENENDQYDEGESFWPEEIQVRQYYLQRIRQSYSASFDYKINANHTLTLRGIYNRRKDWENRYRTIYSDIEEDNGQWMAELERETKGGTEGTKFRRLEDQQMMTFSLAGDHLFGRTKVDWSGAFSKASEDRPNERYYSIATDGTVPVNVNFQDSEFPMISATGAEFQNPSSSWELNEITEEFQYTQDVDFNSKINVTIPLLKDKNTSFLKFGLRLRSKTKSRNNDFYGFEPSDNSVFDNGLMNLQNESKNNFLPGNYSIGSFISDQYLGDLALNGNGFEKEQDLSELAGNFDASESIFGSYIMVNHRFTEKFKAIAGVRLERTLSKYSGFVFDEEEETLNASGQEENKYMNILPGLHLRYALSRKTIIRAAYTNTLARPNYFDLVPYREIAEGEELSIGNPDLVPTTSSNIDLMIERYFGNVGLLSGGVFYKDISNFIVNQTFEDYEYEGTVWGDFSQPINGGNASLFGAEVAFQRQLDFITPALKGFGLYVNYTFIKSQVTDFNFEGREDDEIALPGSPDHTLNVSLSYDTRRFTARVSLNYASEFIDEVGSETFSDRYYDQATYLDFNMNYSLTSKWVIYANANNLLNQPLRYFQGVQTRTMQSEYYNVRFDLGVKYDLTR